MLKPWSWWTTAAEDHTDCRSCQLRTGNMNQHCKKQWKRNRRLNGIRFLLRHSDARVTLWCKNIHPAMCQQLRLVVWGIFFLARNGPLSASWAFLSTAANLSTLADKCRHREPLGCAGMGDSYMNVQQLCDAVVSVWTKISKEGFQQHLVEGESVPWSSSECKRCSNPVLWSHR